MVLEKSNDATSRARFYLSATDLQASIIQEEEVSYKKQSARKIGNTHQVQIIRSMKTNATRASNATRKVVEFFSERGIKVLSAHLKLESHFSADVLVTVSDEDFVRESFADVYAYVQTFRNNISVTRVPVNFSFVNRSDSFDIEAVHADGYTIPFSQARINSK